MFRGRFSSSQGLVGIDIGSRAIKLMQIREQQGQITVVGAAKEQCVDQDGEHVLDESLAQRLRMAISSNGFTGRRCVVSLPRTALHVQSLRLPQMPDNELHQAAVWEAADRFNLDREAMEIQTLRTGGVVQSGSSGESREEVLVIAASHELLNRYLQPVLDAGLRPVAVDTGFAAIARLLSRQLRREKDQSHIRAVLEVGAGGTTFMILRGDRIAFCKPLGIGGKRFNEAVADHLDMDPIAAAELRAARIAAAREKRSDLSTPDQSTDRAVFEAVRPLMGELAKEVTLCLRYFSVTFRGKPPEALILAGGDGLEPHMEEMIQQGCKVPVVFDDAGNTLAMISEQLHQGEHRAKEPAACWAAAAGLSIRNIVRKSHKPTRDAEEAAEVPDAAERGVAA